MAEEEKQEELLADPEEFSPEDTDQTYSAPTLSVSMYRKINMGHYENTDIGQTIVMPLKVSDPTDVEEVQQEASKVFDANLRFISGELRKFVQMIKDSRRDTEGTPKKGKG